MTQAICDITTDEVNVDVVVEPQADTMVEVANRAGGMEQVFHDNTLIGNGNSVDLGVNTDIIATKEYVDEKVESIDTYTKDQIDGKLTAVDAQIDANADAIQKTREDYIQADSELQTQITAQAAEIATKQDKLIAGDNIIISNNVISATGAGGGAGFDIQVVQELPATGQKGIIYLLAKDGAAPDVYDEYVWIESTQTFELIGTTQVDLTDYAKKDDLSEYLPLSGGTMTGPVEFKSLANKDGFGFAPRDNIGFNTLDLGSFKNGVFTPYVRLGSTANPSITPLYNGSFTLGGNTGKWQNVYTQKLNNGANIAIPTTGGTMALVEDINAIGGDGTAGQVLTKTDTGMAWADASGGDGDIDCGVMS